MTLFTAEGILRAETRGRQKATGHPPGVIFYAYQRWLLTQGYPESKEYEWIYDGWLMSNKEIYAKRAPGNTCISALLSKRQGTMEQPVNDSKGCGGVMRVAPAGLFYPADQAFDLAAEFAALTHGHPSGYLSAGALGYLIALIVAGQAMEPAVENTLRELRKHESHRECTRSLEKAIELSRSNIFDTEAISQIGQGWVGEEALAISVYCSLKYQDNFAGGLRAAVNHDGDSDSTGAITGNILGAYLGQSKIPGRWAAVIELKEILMQIADDLLAGYREGPEWRDRYPGY